MGLHDELSFFVASAQILQIQIIVKTFYLVTVVTINVQSMWMKLGMLVYDHKKNFPYFHSFE